MKIFKFTANIIFFLVLSTYLNSILNSMMINQLETSIEKTACVPLLTSVCLSQIEKQIDEFLSDNNNLSIPIELFKEKLVSDLQEKLKANIIQKYYKILLPYCRFRVIKADSILMPVVTSYNGNFIAAVGFNGIAYLWSTPECKLIFEIKDRDSQISSVIFSHDDEFIITSSYDGSCSVWNRHNGNLISKFKAINLEQKEEKRALTKVVISKDDKYIALASEDGTGSVWNLVTEKMICKLSECNSNINKILISEDNDFVIGSSREFIYIWDLFTGNKISQLLGNILKLFKNKFLITKNWNQDLKIWDIKKKFYIYSLSMSNDIFSFLSNSDNNLAFAGIRDGILIFSLKSLSNLNRPILINKIHIKKGLISAMGLSKNNFLVVSGWTSKSQQILDIKTGSLLAELITGNKIVKSINITSDNMFIIENFDNSNDIYIWDIAYFKDYDLDKLIYFIKSKKQLFL